MAQQRMNDALAAWRAALDRAQTEHDDAVALADWRARLQSSVVDLPDRWLDWRWRHVPIALGGMPFARHVARGLLSGSFWHWPIGGIIRRHARRIGYAALIVGAIAVGYNQGIGHARLDEMRRKQASPANSKMRWIDPRCELERGASPPVIWMGEWKHQVRALSGVKPDDPPTRGAYSHTPLIRAKRR